MNDEVLLNEYVAEHDRILDTCDAYDVKSSIWLVVIIFAAAQTGYLLGKNMSPYLVRGQWLSAILLVVSGISTLFELYPRDYNRYSASDGVLEKWIAEMRKTHSGETDAEALILKKGTAYRLLWFKQMIANNKALNLKKARLLLFSFWTAAVATGTNLLTLAILRLASQSR